jgi:hypothetical protein
MLYIGTVEGGPELSDCKICKRISSLISLAIALRKEYMDDTSALNVVFHISGSILSVDFSGLRTAKFSKKEKMLMIQVAVPKGLKKSEIDDFLITSLRQAASLAISVFKKAKLDFNDGGYLNLVERIEHEFRKESGGHP